MKHVLFICTGNVFRSFSAMKCLQQYLITKDISTMSVDSRGIGKFIGKRIERVHPATKEQLREYSINPNYHRRKKVTKKDIENADIIIAMAKNHQDYIQKNFGVHAPLFNELIGKGKTSVIDVCDAFEKWETVPEESFPYIKGIVKYIHDNIPKLYKKIQ